MNAIAQLGELFNNGMNLPRKAMIEGLQIIKDFITLAIRIEQTPIPLQSDDDSPDSYADDSLALCILEEENREFRKQKRQKLGQVSDAFFHSA